MSLDPSDFTSARAKVGLFAARKGNKIVVGYPGEVREFTARALTDAAPLSRDQQKKYVATATTPDPAVAGVRIGRYIIKAIIVGDANGDVIPAKDNPHRYHVDPCKLGSALDLPTAISLTKTFPSFVTSKDFAMSDASPIRQNDIVKVTLTVGPDGALNRNQGEILSLVETADPRLPTDQQCESLQGKFAVSTIELLGVVTGASTGAGTQSTDTAGQGNYTIDEIVCTDVYDEFYLTHPLLTEANLNSPHGMRTRKGKKRMHKGIDLRAKLNTNVYAAADGTVKGLYKDFSSTGGAGNYVKIDHTDGYQTKYFHLIRQPTHIKAGDTVKAGDLIGNSGDTGNTTKPYAPHLHFELWKGSTHIDPMPFIKTIQKCGDTTPPMLAAADPFTSNTASDEEDLPSNAGEAEG